MQQSTTVIIPVFNEENGIQQVLEKIIQLKIHERFEIICVDDGSSDQTPDILKKYPVTVLTHHVNMGYGASLKTGIRKASGEKIIIMDSDGQHDPAYLDEFDRLLDNYSIVIGERTSDSVQTAHRKTGKRLIRKVGEFLVESKLPDFNSGYRGFRKEYLKPLLHIMPNGFSFSTTSTLAFIKEGHNIGTLPIKVSERVGRRSDLKLMKDGSKTMLLLFRIIMLFNPLKVFYPASISSFVFGAAFGLVGYFRFGRFSNGAVILIIFGMFLFFIGLLADQISIMNRKENL